MILTTPSTKTMQPVNLSLILLPRQAVRLTPQQRGHLTPLRHLGVILLILKQEVTRLSINQEEEEEAGVDFSRI